VYISSLEDKIVKYFSKVYLTKSVSRYAPLTEQRDTLLRLIEKKQLFPLMKRLTKIYHQDQQNLGMRLKKLTFMILKLTF